MTKTLVIGRTYAVTTSGTCDVTDANGTLITTATAGQQVVFVAPTTTVSFSDDAATVVAVFKLALAKTRLFEQLGGGRLPSDYLPALFLEGTGEQNIAVQTYQILNVGDVFSCKIDCQFLSTGQRSLVGWVGKAGFYWGRENTAIGISSSPLSVAPDQRHTFTYSVIKDDREGVWPNYLSAGGDEVVRNSMPSSLPTLWQYGLFAFGENVVYPGAVRVWSFKLIEGGEPCILSPAISPTGEPCMFDKVTKQPFLNSGSGSFIVGLTVEQARKLGKLPADATTKTLTISLPQSAFVDVETGEIADAAVNAALAQAEAKGWVITKQYYTE